MDNKKRFLVASLVFSYVLLSCGWNQAIAQNRKGYPVKYNESLPDYFRRWANQPWSGDDAPYKHVRVSVDEALARTTDKNVLVDQYKTIARSMPNDSIAQFRWGYAVFQAYKNTSLRDPKFNEVIYPLSQVTAVSNYEFIRLRFLLEQSGAFANYLDDLGIRLAERSPEDSDVLVANLGVLLSSSNIANRRRTVEIAERLYKQNPKDVSVQRKVALVYELSCVRDNNIEHGRKAIQYCEVFMKQSNDPTQIKYYSWLLKKAKQRLEKISKAKS